MTSNKNIWDILGKSSFNTHVKEDEIDPRAADNILIAWPPILKLIQSQFPPSKEIKALDYGCGVGGFCNRLNEIGYKVTGLDASEGMIDTAKKNSPSEITYLQSDQTIIPTLGKFNIITTIMTLQFIENIEKVFKTLSNALVKGGILVIVDFNREHVKECLKTKISFTNFDSNQFPVKGWKMFGEIKTPVFIRDEKEYAKLANINGLTKVLEEYPPFTKEFINKYPLDKRPKNVSEYLILGYKKL